MYLRGYQFLYGEKMLNFPIKYRIKFIENKTDYIASNHEKKELLISKDIKLNITDDGKLCATFQKKSKDDCSVTISDPSKFNYCVKKEGAYQLFGSDVTFDGTDNDDILVLSECLNSNINMGDGDDTVLYREKRIYNNNINLGNGNNIFAASYKTDADRSLVDNTISSGKGQDYIYLRNAFRNIVSTGAGDDFVEIEGASQTKFTNIFQKNWIKTQDGDDTVKISGNFEKFKNNNFYLGKGSDTFIAEINLKDDATTEYDYLKKISEYVNSVSGNKICATDGEKGWFEKNVFESKTYSANQLSENCSLNAISKGFQNFTPKPVPVNYETDVPKKEVVYSSKKPTIENCKRRYWAGSLGYNLFNDPKMQEAAFKALDDYVNSMK